MDVVTTALIAFIMLGSMRIMVEQQAARFYSLIFDRFATRLTFFALFHYIN